MRKFLLKCSDILETEETVEFLEEIQRHAFGLIARFLQSPRLSQAASPSALGGKALGMKTSSFAQAGHRCKRHHFRAEIIAHAVWLYYRFPVGLRHVEDLLAERGIDVSFQTVSK
ncbi:hypothetical protein [Rhizobium sp. ST-5]|uniref:hypothetical protein n=1 Tax=Rhizobium TaxID=379 RepID=UPI003CEEC1B0